MVKKGEGGICSIWTAVFILFFAGLTPVNAAQNLHIPEPLQPWKAWVLHGKEDRLACVAPYDNGALFYCAWPGQMELDLNSRGGVFSQQWQVRMETWVPLPGSDRQWPLEVRVDDRVVTIVEKNKRPGLILPKGTHGVEGRFAWSGLPEYVKLPEISGLVALRLDNTPVPFPDLDRQGRLWFSRQVKKQDRGNQVKIESYRLIDDDIPARMQLHVDMDISGTPRTITLGPLVDPDRFIPLGLKSDLPARLEADGRMKVQVRPGKFQIRLDARVKGPLKELGCIAQDNAFWPRKEIWSFKARPDLRLVEVQGPNSIDPVQTSMPKNWHGYPAYLMEAGTDILFKEIKRGDPDPAPDQLALDRNLWLRFDGSGFTIQDRVTGVKNTHWRLEMNPEIELGSVTVDGKEQLITRQDGSEKSGIELRNGAVNFTAESLYMTGKSGLPAPVQMPVIGWDHDFTKVTGRLFLPPGWTLVHGSGMDRVSATWVQQWTLLDFFIVLIFTIALGKLYSKKLGCLAFFTLVLIYHEPGAPRYIWPALLVGFALLKTLPQGRLKNMVQLYQLIAGLCFLIIVIPYSIQALRVGIYPQLAQPWTVMAKAPGGYGDRAAQTSSLTARKAAAPQTLVKEMADLEEGARQLGSLSSPPLYKSVIADYDPKALTQTGPGLPAFRPFETVSFSWSGPVTRDQQMGFTLIGPKVNLVLAFLRVFLIVALALGMFNVRKKWKKGEGLTWSKALAPLVLVPLVLAAILTGLPAQGQAREIPSQDLLDELEQRLLEKDDCFPSCALVPELFVTLGPDQLELRFSVDAARDTAIPVPGNPDLWRPVHAQLNQQEGAVLLRKKDRLWLMVPKGSHEVALSGPVPQQGSFQLPFHLKPKHLDLSVNGWEIDGMHGDGSFDDLLQFRRIRAADETEKELLETGTLPPFARVERTLGLGLVWKVVTRVTRLGQPGAGMSLNIPLLDGESITTQGIHVKDGKASVSLGANQNQVVWESFLEKGSHIRLEHAQTHEWTEVWTVDVSPIFHMAYKGIPVILHKSGTRWHPVWHPWPGESVDLTLTRPEGVKGPTLTLEKSHLELWPGRNSTRARLDLTLKSSQGGQHGMTLPPGAKLQEVKINNKVHPIRAKDRKVSLPITPGTQKIEMTWLSDRGLTPRYVSPEIDLGISGVNPSVDIHLPRNRWPLFVGGDHLAGPAVLFWSVLIVVFMVAFGLSKTGWAGLKFYQWLLLCVGMAMSHVWAGMLVVAWLIGLDARKKADPMTPGRFNLVQAGLVMLTLAALVTLIFMISNGLLGHPDMNIQGNGSSAGLLRWYHDVSSQILPRAWVISIPMLFYRAAMLAWALWLSFWLVGILKWGWQNFSSPQIWQKMAWRFKRPDPEAFKGLKKKGEPEKGKEE